MLRAVVTDTKELRTASHDAALPVFFIQEQTRMAGFEPFVGHAFFPPMSWLFSILFYVSRHASHDPGFRFAQIGGILDDALAFIPWPNIQPKTLVESIVLSQKHRKMELRLNPR